tara:strand:- start:745 stop:2481 length:1737 start_codon:yes stop_codon:yes gene_type:complete
MAQIIEVDFFNTYVLKKKESTMRLYNPGGNNLNTSNSRFVDTSAIGEGYGDPILEGGTDLQYFPKFMARRWYIEESRIKGGFNNTATDQGVRAYLDEENPLQQERINTLIYSGIYNSRTGINNTNVFSVADAITKSLDISHGSIQKTFAEETNLIVFQENRIHRALIDKDTIYTTESGTQTQAGAAVIGQFIQYKGDYGISKNPESFAIYNNRKYFSDKSRNTVLRLSNNGFTEISAYGMMDYFRDNLAEIKNEYTINTIGAIKDSGGVSGGYTVDVTTAEIITCGMSIEGQDGYVTFIQGLGANEYKVFNSKPFNYSLPGVVVFTYKTRGKVVGGWDIHNKNYVISLQKNTNQVADSTDQSTYKTLSFDDKVNGWVSFFTYKPNFIFSNLNKFYSVENKDLYKHYFVNAQNNTRGLFYSNREPSSITFVFNAQPSMVKNFLNISYEGSNGWEIDKFVSGFEGFDSVNSNWEQFQDSILPIKSYDQGLYSDPITQQPKRAGFNRKENKYVANLVANSEIRPGEVRFGPEITGVKGYFATVKFKTDEDDANISKPATNLGGPKELWSAATSVIHTTGFN